ncbi:MAG: hypothetical protein ACYC1I_05800 [Acidimicrobiales bacterium]
MSASIATMIHVPGWLFDETVATANAALKILADETVSMREREIASESLAAAALWLSFASMPETTTTAPSPNSFIPTKAN